jgi:gentisate 1,2-dioxygenase
MAVHALRMSRGFESKPRRTTANAIYVVLEGSGVSQVGEHTLNWERGDVFVVPAWQSFTHSASSDSHLIRVSDEPIMKAFDFLRTA